MSCFEDYNDELDSEGKFVSKENIRFRRAHGQLMDDLLKLSRVTRSELSTEKLDLSEMARKIVRELAEDEPKRKVESYYCTRYEPPMAIRICSV